MARALNVRTIDAFKQGKTRREIPREAEGSDVRRRQRVSEGDHRTGISRQRIFGPGLALSLLQWP